VSVNSLVGVVYRVQKLRAMSYRPDTFLSWPDLFMPLFNVLCTRLVVSVFLNLMS